MILLSILLLAGGIGGLRLDMIPKSKRGDQTLTLGDVTPVLKKRQDQTPTFDASSPTSSPFLLLHDFGFALTTCIPVNVTWAYSGPPLPLDFVATNIGVLPPPSQVSRINTFTDGQMLVVPSGAPHPQPTQALFAQGILPQASVAPWNVNVPSGWYQIFATLDTIYEDQTDSFFVQPGADTSCLLDNSLTTSAHSLSLTSVTPISMAFSSGKAGESAGPQLPMTTKHNTHVGIIAGLSVGFVTGVAVIMLLCWWRRRRLRNRISMPTQRSTYGILGESLESLRRASDTLIGGVFHISAPQHQNHDTVQSFDSMSGGNLMMEIESDSRLSHSTINAPTLPSYRSRTTEPPQYRSTLSDHSLE